MEGLKLESVTAEGLSRSGVFYTVLVQYLYVIGILGSVYHSLPCYSLLIVAIHSQLFSLYNMENNQDNTISRPDTAIENTRPPPPPPPPTIYQQRQPSKSLPLFAPAKIPETNTPKAPFTPCYLFAYGTLTDPEVLEAVLSLPSTPTLNEGWITGFKIKMWGIYPTLIPSPEGQVSGKVWEVETKAQFDRLAEYETSAYTPCSCKIYLKDGREEANSRVFVWARGSNK